MSKKISELTDAAALDGTEQVELVQSGGNVKATVNDIFPVQLQGDKTIDLNEHTLRFGGAGNYLEMSSFTDDSNHFEWATGHLGSENEVELTATATDIQAQFTLTAVFNDGETSAYITGTAESGSSSLSYTADAHIFNLSEFADDAAAATGGIPVGGLYHTAGAVKIRLS